MTDRDPDEVSGTREHLEQLTANDDVLKAAWEETLEEMEAREAELEADGWSVTTVPAGHTAPESPRGGSSDRWGVIFTIPGNYAAEVREALEAAEYPQYDVYRREVERRVFLLCEYRDSDAGMAVLAAGSYPMAFAGGVMEKAREEEMVYSYLRTLDDTYVGVFEHDRPEKFFPRFGDVGQ